MYSELSKKKKKRTLQLSVFNLQRQEYVDTGVKMKNLSYNKSYQIGLSRVILTLIELLLLELP